MDRILWRRHLGGLSVVSLVIIGALSPQFATVGRATEQIVRESQAERAVEAMIVDAEFSTDRVIVHYQDDVSERRIERDNETLSEAVTIVDIPTTRDEEIKVVELDDTQAVSDALVDLNSDPNIAFAEPDYKIRLEASLPDDTRFGDQWGLHNTGQVILGQSGTADSDIDAPEAWDITTGSGTTIIAVIDTGVQITHPDLVNKLWVNPGEIAGNNTDDDNNGYIDDVHGWDFKNNDNSLYDGGAYDAHGTHVAGIIAAETGNGAGIAGINPEAKIMVLKALDGVEGGYISDIIEAINYAKSFGVKVSNNSYGGGSSSASFRNAIADSNMLFVAAAGNSGTDADNSPTYPAAYDLTNVVSVAAVNNQDELASFSNFGNVSVDLAAPGEDIRSTYPPGGYQYQSGTSMATPFVTGVASLLLDTNPYITVEQMKDVLMNSVDEPSDLDNIVLSNGRVNAERAVQESSSLPLYLSYEAENLAHDIGTQITDTSASQDAAWKATVRTDGEGYLQYGPANIIPAGAYTASFRLKTSRNRDTSTVARIEIYNVDTDETITAVITGKDFTRANRYQDFAIDFDIASDSTMEFNVYFEDVVDITSDTIAIEERDRDTYQAEYASGDIGIRTSESAAHNGGARKATVNNDAAGYLAQIDAGTFEPDTYTAVFRMKVARMRGTAAVATLEVTNLDTPADSVSTTIYPSEVGKSNAFINYMIPFTVSGTDDITLRIMFADTADIVLDKVTIFDDTLTTTVESESASYDTGVPYSDVDGDGVQATVIDHVRGYLQHNAIVTDQLPGTYVATFRLKVGMVDRNKSVATLEVFNQTTGRVISRRTVKSQDFAATDTFQNFSMYYARPSTGDTDYRIAFSDQYDITADRVTVVPQESL